MGDIRKKKGQVTIFIIIGLIIVAAALLIFAFAPKIKSTTSFDIKNPNLFIQQCVEEDLEDLVETISIQGGSIEPSSYYLYNDEHLGYLCYNTEDYKLCKVQVPFLRDHIEEELNQNINNKINSCFNSMVESYRDKGYEVKAKSGTTFTELLPNKILITLRDYEIVAKKGETENFKSFSIVLDNNLYELVSIASNIVDWETNIGDADANTYMLFYPDLKIEKLKQTEGTTLYILTNKKQENKFQFASRSLVFPAGV